jgi:hypothetical protein
LNLINKILTLTGYVVNPNDAIAKEREAKAKEREYSLKPYQKLLISYLGNVNKQISAILFSKDRAMQASALLASYFYHVDNAAPVTVLYTCSSPEHYQAYEILKQECKPWPVTFLLERNFKDDLLNIISGLTSDRLFFMTDDAVFKDKFNLADVLPYHPAHDIFSLRVGKDFTFCYSHNKLQQVPVLNWDLAPIHSWMWQNMAQSPDWSYPLSVDANIFSRMEMFMLLSDLPFNSPNSLEGNLQRYNALFCARNGVCFTNTKYVNIPCNLVQQDYQNISTGFFSTQELLALFLDGKRIAWQELAGKPARQVQLTRFNFSDI